MGQESMGETKSRAATMTLNRTKPAVTFPSWLDGPDRWGPASTMGIGSKLALLGECIFSSSSILLD